MTVLHTLFFTRFSTLLLPRQEGDGAGEDVNDEDEEPPAGAGKGANLTPPPPPPAPPAPDTQLSLEWVYGYSAASSRASVRYTASDATPDGVGVVYPAGKVAVVLAQPLDEEGVEMEGDPALAAFFPVVGGVFAIFLSEIVFTSGMGRNFLSEVNCYVRHGTCDGNRYTGQKTVYRGDTSLCTVSFVACLSCRYAERVS